MSVLDAMTKGVTEGKRKVAGPTLTPVGTESSGVKPSMLPADLPGAFMNKESLQEVAASLRSAAATLIATADGIDVLTGVPEPTKQEAAKLAAIEKALVEKEADRKAADKAAPEPTDDSFSTRMKRLQDEAQAAAFKPPAVVAYDAPVEEPERAQPAATKAWACPEHGTKDIKRLTSRKGRTYSACGSCEQFEKE